MKTNGA